LKNIGENMKKLIIEIIIIVSVSTIIALLYNHLRTDGIPLIPKSKAELMVSDSFLFGDIFNQEGVNEEGINEKFEATNQEDINREEPNEVLIDTAKAVEPQAATEVAENKIEEIDAATILRNVRKTPDGIYGIISFEQMKRIVDLNDDNFVIIDARQEIDYLEGHIPRAINISPDEEIKAIEKVLQLPKTKTFIIYCDGGNCGASKDLAAILDSFGYQRFFIYDAGWEEWSKSQ